MLIPVRSVTVALPPVMSIAETMMLVANPKNRNVRWAARPQRHAMTSKKVCGGWEVSARGSTKGCGQVLWQRTWACGAFIFIFAAFWAKRRICIVAPAALHSRERCQLPRAKLGLGALKGKSQGDAVYSVLTTNMALFEFWE